MSDAFLAQQNQYLDLSTVAQAMRRSDWPKWKDAMDAELESFYSRRCGSLSLIGLSRHLKPIDKVQMNLCEEV